VKLTTLVCQSIFRRDRQSKSPVSPRRSIPASSKNLPAQCFLTCLCLCNIGKIDPSAATGILMLIRTPHSWPPSFPTSEIANECVQPFLHLGLQEYKLSDIQVFAYPSFILHTFMHLLQVLQSLSFSDTRTPSPQGLEPLFLSRHSDIIFKLSKHPSLRPL
jgi:hypothetical protein